MIELILILLVGTLMGAFFMGFFLLGYYVRGKKANEEGVTVTHNNMDFIESMAKWRQFDGRQ